MAWVFDFGVFVFPRGGFLQIFFLLVVFMVAVSCDCGCWWWFLAIFVFLFLLVVVVGSEFGYDGG